MATDPTAQPRPRGWPLFLLGVLVFFTGPILYALQVGVFRQTVTPWYLLVLISAGVVLMALSLLRRFSILRTIGLVVFAILTGLEMFMFFGLSRTPPYTGPAQVKAAAPVFETTIADGKDGKKFSNADLTGDGKTIILFFRGKW